MNKRNTFYAGKKPAAGKNILMIIGCVALAAALFVAAFFGVRAIKNHSSQANESRAAGYGKFSWKEGGFENAGEVKCFNELYLVYQDSASTMRGLKLLDGKDISAAEYTQFKMCSDAWRSDRLLAAKAN